MTKIIFRKNFELKADSFGDLINNFPYAHEFYTAIILDEGELPKGFIDAVAQNKNVEDEYGKLNSDEKADADELMFSFSQLTPEFIYNELKNIIPSRILEKHEDIKTKRGEALSDSTFLSMCKPQKLFSGISDGELVSLPDDYLDEKKYWVVK